MSDQGSERAINPDSRDIGLGLTQVTQSVPSHLANPRQRQAILARIAEGERILDIAQDLGIPRSTLSWQLRKHVKDDYMAARHTKAEALLDDAIDGMMAAEDALALARARETFNAARFLAEREHPERWGQRQEITHRTVDLASELERAHERLVGSSTTSSVEHTDDTSSNR